MKRFWDGSLNFKLGLAVFLIIILPTAKAQTSLEIIEFKPHPIPFVPKEFFIHEVFGSYDANQAIGTIVTNASASDSHTVTRSVNFKNGSAGAINNFLKISLPVVSNLRPVNLHVKEFKISESQKAAGLVEGNVQISVEFELLRNGRLVKLVQYNGGSTYTRSIKNLAVIEPVLRKTVTQAMQYFNVWINREAATNEKLADKLRITFTDLARESGGDTLFYSKTRPLLLSDFTSAPDIKSRFAAEIFSFFSFEESSSVANSTVFVNLNVNAYLIKSFSWIKTFAADSYTLNHEQRHFDIVKIAAERFKENIKNQSLSIDNYEGVLSMEYLESLREMNRLQVQYDKETGHGTNPGMQAVWNQRIDAELLTLQSSEVSSLRKKNLADFR